MTNTFVLKGNICQTSKTREIELFEGSYLVCVDGVSRGIFNTLPEEYKSLELIDYKNALILPGMIDLHLHAPQYSYRGTSMDLELIEWLDKYTFAEEEKFSDISYAMRAYSIFVEDMKRGATTRACIFATRHREATELLMELIEESGLISYVGKVNMDREAKAPLVEPSAEASAMDTFRFINSVKDKFKRTYPILTPRFIPSCTDELMENLREIQMAYGIPVQSHLSESVGEIELVRALRPDNSFYGESYNDYDLFGVNDDIDTEFKTVMAHCVWSTDDEVELMRKNRVYVAHCPTSNTNLSSGIAPIRKYIELGLNVGLGTDVAAGHSASIFYAITDAIRVSKLYFRLVNENAPPLLFSDALYLATRGGGSFFGKVGAFDEGYELDAIVIDDSVLTSPRDFTLAERLERAVYLGLDEKALTAKYVAGAKISLECLEK